MMNSLFSANTVPELSIVLGTETVNGNNYVYLNLNAPVLIALNATDDGTVTYDLVNTTTGVATVAKVPDGSAVMTVTVADTNPVRIR